MRTPAQRNVRTGCRCECAYVCALVACLSVCLRVHLVWWARRAAAAHGARLSIVEDDARTHTYGHLHAWSMHIECRSCARALHNKPGACAQGEAALKTTGSLPFSGACARRPGYNAEAHTPWLGTAGHFRSYTWRCSQTKGMNGGTPIAPDVEPYMQHDRA